jgi:hypothetical protein
MSFLDKVPVYIKDIEGEIVQLNKDRLSIDWGHECDCEYCDRQDELSEDADEQIDKIDKIDEEIDARHNLIKKLDTYKKMFNK